MNNLTAVIITCNEEEMIQGCLESLVFVDQILVIDSASTDNTVKIAQKFKAKIYQHSFTDFSSTRNYALNKVNSKWILYIDADERVSPELREDIIKIVSQKEEYNAYKIIRQNYYLGCKWPYQEQITRLFKKDKLKMWYGDIHESPQIEGKVGILNGLLNHYTHRSLTEMVAKTNVWSETEAKLLYQANHPPITWWRLIRIFLTGFYRYFIKQKGYLAGTVGLIESIYQGFSLFITYIKLWELQKKP